MVQAPQHSHEGSLGPSVGWTTVVVTKFVSGVVDVSCVFTDAGVEAILADGGSIVAPVSSGFDVVAVS